MPSCPVTRRLDIAGGATGWEVVHADVPLIARGEARYRDHADKAWSLTDCINMEVMTQRHVHDVATLDRGFAQAGFKLLMR
jgi:predicted nucleic acid-binding protein